MTRAASTETAERRVTIRWVMYAFWLGMALASAAQCWTMLPTPDQWMAWCGLCLLAAIALKP